MPLPWVAGAPGFGFSPTGATWLPQPPEFAEYAVDVQSGVEGSTLELYRAALRLRRDHRLGRGRIRWLDSTCSAWAPERGVLAFDNGPIRVVVNVGSGPVPLGPSGPIVCRSGPLAADGSLPQDTAVWLLRR